MGKWGISKKSTNSYGLNNFQKGYVKNPFTLKSIGGLDRSVSVSMAYHNFNVINKGLHDGLIIGQEQFEIKLNIDENYKDKIVNLLVCINKVGYYAVAYSLFKNDILIYNKKYSPLLFKAKLKELSPDSITFYVKPKYGAVVPVPPFIYYVTNSKHLEDIYKFGIRYDTQYKFFRIPYRIYFMSDDLYYSSDVVKNLWFGKIPRENLISIKVDTSNLDFLFYEDSVRPKICLYTHTVIKASNIVDIKYLTDSQVLKPHLVGRIHKNSNHERSTILPNTQNDWKIDNIDL